MIEATSKVINPKIMLLVKDAGQVKKLMTKSKKAFTNRYHKIYGIEELQIYYKRMMNDLKNQKINKFIKIASKRNNDEDQGIKKIDLRFHQRYVVDYTFKKIKEKKNKFIWGAVPRSGKTFMIGGLIELYQPQNVIIFLGAVTETNKQFEKELFEKYKGSFDYNIYNKHSENKKNREFINIKHDKKNIVLISMQKGWQNQIDTNIQKILNNSSKKMIFFDESHQGGKGEKVEEMLKKYVFNNTNKFPFIMVTATFANPLLRFGNEGEQFWNEKANLIQWSYEDIEFMKEINKEDGYESIIERLENQNDGESKVKEFKKILKEFEDKSITRESLASYYEKEYPELVVMCPSLELNNEQINEYNAEKNVFKEEQIDIKTLFELKTTERKNLKIQRQ